MGKGKRKVPGINASSTADISFILLIFFLVVTSMNSSTGLNVRLPEPPEDEDLQNPPKIKKRNSLIVLVNMDNKIMVTQGEKPPYEIDVTELRQLAKEFISNDENRPDYPEKHAEDIVFEDRGVEHVLPSGRQQNVTSKHVISLQTHRGTNYNTYFEVSNSLYGAYDELRDELAQKEFGKPYVKLEEAQQMLCRLYYKTMISEAEPRQIGGGM
ncbi:MAG: biopolymer transporter ExbD [Bacteroidaceae bacterium]|nr:biopolymer transporter ExbD [Bacteroidaceae bacterium]